MAIKTIRSAIDTQCTWPSGFHVMNAVGSCSRCGATDGSYAAMDAVLSKARVFNREAVVIEVDSGVFVMSPFEASEEFEGLAPGESFTVHAVCDLRVEADAFVVAHSVDGVFVGCSA